MRQRIRRSLLVPVALIATACGADSPSLTPSALGPPASLRLNATAGTSAQHEHGHAAATMISIVGTVGPAAFMPNPLEAAIGSMLVWMNSDSIVHEIVLADGTPVGRMAPGEMSAPVTMSTASMAYRCTLHPSMTGIIADPSVVMPTPPPTDNYPAPDDGYYDY